MAECFNRENERKNRKVSGNSEAGIWEVNAEAAEQRVACGSRATFSITLTIYVLNAFLSLEALSYRLLIR